MSNITTERYYKITFPEGSIYYGRTTQGGERYKKHLSMVRRDRHPNKHIQEVYNKYGYDDWVHEWLFYETGDKDYHSRIELGMIQANPKSLNIKDGRYIQLSEEEFKQKNKEESKIRFDNETPEQSKERKAKQRKRYHLNRQNETPEQREKRLTYHREYERIKRENKNK